MYKLIIGIMLFSMASCSSKVNNNLVLSMIDSSFMHSIKLADESSDRFMKNIAKKMYEPCDRDIATIQYSKAEHAQVFTKKLLEEIEAHKLELNKQQEANNFFVEGKAETIMQSIRQLKDSVEAIDTSIHDKFYGVNFNSLVKDYETILGKNNQQQLQKMDIVDGLVLLNTLSVRVHVLQSELMDMFYKKCFYVDGCPDRSHPEIMVTQNSNIVYAGSKVEIVAGIAEFQLQAQPIISINHKPVELQAGKATYQLKVTDIPGSYEIPVMIKYRSQKTGQYLTENRKVYYTVVKKD